MNDLDKRIAELKGFCYEEDESGVSIYDKDSLCIHDTTIPELKPSWSTSDAKALELVDELGLPFQLSFNHLNPETGDVLVDWYAAFMVGDLRHGGVVTWIGRQGKTRPEAICRAYIAAMEFIKDKAPAPTPPAV